MIGRVARARRQRASAPVVIGVVVGVFGVVALLGVLSSRRDEAKGADERAQRAVIAYEDAIAPAVEAAGRAIVAGIRADLSDFTAGRISVAVWQQDLATHTRTFNSVRQTLAATAPPDLLREAVPWFDEAMRLYIHAAEVLAEAGNASGDARERLLDKGAAIGESGDRLFDRGASELQAARRAVGLGPSMRFSDRSPG